MRQSLFFILVLSVFLWAQGVLASEAWMEALMQGNNIRAADLLEKELDRLVAIEKQAQENGPYDTYEAVRTNSDSMALLRQTVQMLRSDCHECAESAKVTLFRSTVIGRIDIGSGPQGAPLFFAKGMIDLETRAPRPGRIDRIARSMAWARQEAHTEGRNMENSPYISTAVVPGSSGADMMVLRVCPQRLVLTKNASEHEVLLPFFIHPSEVVAIVRPSWGGTRPVDNGNFDFIYRNDALQTHPEDQTKSLIQQWTAESRRLSSEITGSRSEFLAGMTNYQQAMIQKSNHAQLSCSKVY